jgi:hypothetical protein
MTVLERIAVEAGDERAMLEPIELPYRHAGRALMEAPGETFAVAVESPDVGRIELASASLAGRATVVTLTLDASGAVNVTHNLLRYPDRAYPDEPAPEIPYAEMVRTLQIAQQLYKSGDLVAVHAGLIPDLLYGKWTDPVLGCTGFFAKRSVGAEADFLPPGLMEEAVRNLGRYFGVVPDVSVVRAIALDEPPLLDDLLDRRIVPLLGESVRELAAYAQARGDSDHPIVTMARRVSRDQPWAMTFAPQHAIASELVSG